jgi:histidyl-tRNA synthetase
VWFLGADGAPDEVKDIRSGDQSSADSGEWTPPEDDRYPSISAKPS